MPPIVDSRGLNGSRHDLHHLVPLPLFILELSAPRGNQPVIFCATVVVGGAPLGFYPAAFLHAVQYWKKRTETYLVSALGDLRDASRDSNSVQGLQGERFQDQQVESST